MAININYIDTAWWTSILFACYSGLRFRWRHSLLDRQTRRTCSRTQRDAKKNASMRKISNWSWSESFIEVSDQWHIIYLLCNEWMTRRTRSVCVDVRWAFAMCVLTSHVNNPLDNSPISLAYRSYISHLWLSRGWNYMLGYQRRRQTKIDSTTFYWI